MFLEDDTVEFYDNGEIVQGYIVRRTHLYYPHSVWVVHSLDRQTRYEINEKDLELVKKAVA